MAGRLSQHSNTELRNYSISVTGGSGKIGKVGTRTSWTGRRCRRRKRHWMRKENSMKGEANKARSHPLSARSPSFTHDMLQSRSRVAIAV
jgi:hypothetical protein